MTYWILITLLLWICDLNDGQIIYWEIMYWSRDNYETIALIQTYVCALIYVYVCNVRVAAINSVWGIGSQSWRNADSAKDLTFDLSQLWQILIYDERKTHYQSRVLVENDPDYFFHCKFCDALFRNTKTVRIS